jgi:hypothetical protein
MKNKINTIPIGLYLVWFCYCIYYLFLKIHSNELASEYVISILPILTIFFTILTLIIISFLNKGKKIKFYFDFLFIIIQFIPLMIILISY